MSEEQDNEALRTLGSDLKILRETKGFSLKDVNEKTRISVTILDSIEKGDFHLLPPGVYARNFIRKYADFLGADSQSILEHFKKTEERIAPPVLKKEGGDSSSAVIDRRFWRYLAIGVSVLLLIAILVWFLNSFWNADKSVGHSTISQGDANDSETSRIMSSVDNTAAKSDKVLPLPATPSHATPNVSPPQATAVVNPPPPSLPNASSQNIANVPVAVNSADVGSQDTKGIQGPYRLVIEAKERTWLQIRADKQKTGQIMMNPGERIERKAQERFTLDIGNASGVIVLFQGRKLENLGKKGQVVHLSLP